MARRCVLVVAMPVLNGPWRTRAWPGWLDGMNKRAYADAVNTHLRTIARLVVAPPFRARGVETWLYPWPCPGGKLIRISAQLYNTRSEYEALAALLQEALA